MRKPATQGGLSHDAQASVAPDEINSGIWAHVVSNTYIVESSLYCLSAAFSSGNVKLMAQAQLEVLNKVRG